MQHSSVQSEPKLLSLDVSSAGDDVMHGAEKRGYLGFGAAALAAHPGIRHGFLSLFPILRFVGVVCLVFGRFMSFR